MNLIPIEMTIEQTPNPNCIKLSPGCPLLTYDYTFSFYREDIIEHSEFIKSIWSIDGIVSVMLTYDFLTLTRLSTTINWDDVVSQITKILQHFLSMDQELINEQELLKNQNNIISHYTLDRNLDGMIIEKIESLIELYIQPAVMMDGGFVKLCGYHNGVVYIDLQGACVGCPSSDVTLKSGIEQLLKAEIPEIIAVEKIIKRRF